MVISGLQKLTLLDFPGKTACTVFTPGCNFRCPFCHNASLVTHTADAPMLGDEAFFAFLNKRHGLLDGVAVTGGEPTLQPDLKDFIKRVKSLGFLVKLDTNGTNPALLSELIAGGLVDYVAMDIKTSPERYPVVSGVANPGLSAISESIKLIMNGPAEYEFRTTVASPLHTPADFDGIGRWIQGAGRYYIQNFKDSGDIIQDGMGEISREMLDSMLETVRKYVPAAELRGVE